MSSLSKSHISYNESGYVPKLCDRSVAYQRVQYSTRGWANVSTTKIVQKIAIDFFLVRSE